jgi:hypothetical protein
MDAPAKTPATTAARVNFFVITLSSPWLRANQNVQHRNLLRALRIASRGVGFVASPRSFHGRGVALCDSPQRAGLKLGSARPFKTGGKGMEIVRVIARCGGFF